MVKKYLASELKKRIAIKTPSQTPNDDSGFDRGYKTIKRVWGKIKAISDWAESIRGSNVNDGRYTHEITIRKNAVERIGIDFGKAYSSSYDSIPDLNPLKSNYFFFVENGSTSKGMLYRIDKTNVDEMFNETITYRVIQVEEQGTGFQE